MSPTLLLLTSHILKCSILKFCLPSQLSCTAAFIALRCEHIFLNSMHKQPLPKYTFSFCINSKHQNCEKEMFLFLFSHCWSTLSAWHSAPWPGSAGSPGSVAAAVQTLFSGALALHQAGQREVGSCCKLVLSIPGNICEVRSWR